MRVLGISIACLTVLVYASGLQATTIEGDGSVIVESRTGGKNFADYLDVSTGFPNSWSNSTGKSTAAGTTAGIGCRLNTTSGVGGAATYFEVFPTLPVTTPWNQWEVYVTQVNNTLAVTSTITQTNATGLPATTAAFSGPGNAWILVGTLTVASPGSQVRLRFDETANANRFYADAVKFVPVPEPVTLALLAVGGLFLRRRRA